MKAKYTKSTISLAIPAILSEQITTPDKRSTTSKSKKLSAADKIAKQIYDAKGVVWDDEGSALNAIEKIKSLAQYKDVLKSLQKLTGGRGIGQYLKSFTTLKDRLDVVNHLRTFIPKNQWSWTIEKIIPWDDFKYVNSKIIPGSNPSTAGQSNASTALISYYSDKGLWKAGGPNIDTEFWKDYKHEIMLGAQIGTALIPVVGPFISAGVGLVDAKIYWDEGDRYSAGLMALFSLIPGMGGLAAKLGLTGLVKSLGKAGLTKFITKLKLITQGGKPVLSKEEKKLLKILGEHQKPLIEQVKEFIKKKTASTTGKVIKSGAEAYVASVVAKGTWDPIYNKLGLNLLDIQDAAKPLFEKIKQEVLQTAAVETVAVENTLKDKLHQIVLEEYKKLKLTEALIANKEEGDAFRKWITSSMPMAARRYDIDPAGPWNSPQLQAAFVEHGEEFKKSQQTSKDFEDYKNSPTSTIIQYSGWLFWIGLGIIAVKTGKPVVKGLIRRVLPWLPTGLLEKILNKKISAKMLSNLNENDLRKLLAEIDPNYIPTPEEVTFIRTELNKIDDPLFFTQAVMDQRKRYINDFITYGGQQNGRATAADLIKMMTAEERKAYGQAVYEYERRMSIKRWQP